MKRTKPFLIAEIGINHNGSLDLAKKLIDLAKKNKFDAVKFQKRDPDICVPEHQKSILRETPWGLITYLEYKKKIEFSSEQYSKIDKYCKKLNMPWFLSCWDNNSQKKMKRFKTKFNKIASALATNFDFVNLVAQERKKTFVSTGMCTSKEVDHLVKIFKKNKCPFVLMHTVSSYPCPEKNLNLNLITTYKNKYKCDIGYSGHESTVSPTIFAWILGAEYIERHITLDRSMWGTDQSASLGPEGIKAVSDTLHKAPKYFGDGIKTKTSEDKKIEKKFRYWL